MKFRSFRLYLGAVLAACGLNSKEYQDAYAIKGTRRRMRSRPAPTPGAFGGKLRAKSHPAPYINTQSAK